MQSKKEFNVQSKIQSKVMVNIMKIIRLEGGTMVVIIGMLWFDENVTGKLLCMSDYHVCIYIFSTTPQAPKNNMGVSCM